MNNLQLTDHFTLREFLFSRTAVIKNIPNEIDRQSILNLKKLCVNILEPLRTELNSPIIISSGFRSERLNRAVGGSPLSQHLSGNAADIISNHHSAVELFHKIIEMSLPYDQLILELNSWVHVSYTKNNRNHVLIAERGDKNQIMYKHV